MKVCYFGIYNPNYSRNRILIGGLRKNGVEVIECRSSHAGIFKYFDLVKKHQKIKGMYDAMVVGFPGYQSMIIARLLTRKPIIFDCFTSAYDSLVYDRKQARPRSIKALYYWLLDWLSMWLADKILFDTQAHIAYAHDTFHIRRNKFKRLWIGADTNIFYPREKELWKTQRKVSPFPASLPKWASPSGFSLKAKPSLSFPQFSVLFFGTFIPLQGIEYIIGAAKRLTNEHIRFTIVGNGQMKEKMLSLAEKLHVENINFIDLLTQDELVKKIAAADVCLGIFGNTNKTRRVIPNKVYECLAMKKPVIAADTLAIRELLSDKDVCFVKISDSASLADGILCLKNDRKAMERMAQNGYDTFIKNAMPEILGKELKDIIEEIIK